MSYYNTTNETGETLAKYKEKAITQEDYIMLKMYYATSKDTNFVTSASMFLGLAGFEKSPLTSIRRAITNLVNKGKLVYTGEKRQGLYGRNESIIKLNK